MMKMNSIETKQIYNTPSPHKAVSSNNITTIAYYFPVQWGEFLLGYRPPI
jgi:hypothetical protein